MTFSHAVFDQFEKAIAEGGVDSGLEFLGNQLLAAKEYHQYFEVLKMQARRDTGLALLYEDNLDTCEPAVRKDFEDRLLDACETVGELFFQNGDASNGWVYLQPLADTEKARQLLMNIEVNEENVDDIVQIALLEDVAPKYGFGLVLQHFGTCNSITTYDSQVSMLSKQVKQEAAEMLVAHLYSEICENVKGHIREQEGKLPEASGLLELIQNRDWLFAGGGHHVDTTHLASTIRIARQAKEQKALKLALELAEYGMRLDSQFHFDGDEPFEEIYPDHLRWFQGLVSGNTAEVEAWFLRKIADMEPGMVRSMTVEMLVDFLATSQNHFRAIEVGLKEMGDDHQNMGIAPAVFTLAKDSSDYQALATHFSEKRDLLSYSIARLLESDSTKCQ